MTSRVIYPSQQSIRKVKQALERDRFRHKTLEEIAELSPEVVSRFFQGKPISHSALTQIYSVLELTLEDRDVNLELDNSNETNNLDSLIQKVRQHCCQNIQKHYSKTRLLNGKHAEVERLFLDVYKLEKLPRKSYLTINHLLQNFKQTDDFERFGLGEQKMRWSGLDIANHYPRIIILGKRYFGKTTFLQHLAIACAQGKFKADCIPIFLELKTLNCDETTQQSFLRNQLHQLFGLSDISQTERILHSGKVLLLFDGLDEVNEKSRRNIQYLIRTFSQKFYKNNFILTCQTQATEYTFPTFEYCEIAELNPEQINQFAKIWFTALVGNPVKGESLTNQFISHLKHPQNHRIAKIATNPLIVGLSCWLFFDRKNLPESRYEFYERSLQLFLSHHQQRQREQETAVGINLDWKSQLNLLSCLALITFENQNLFCEVKKIKFYIASYLRFFPSDLESTQELLSTGAALLAKMESQHSLILERSQKIYSLWSLELHEYLVGRLIVDNFNLRDSKDPLNPFTKKTWQESFLLAAEQMRNPDDLLLELKEKVDGLLAVDKKLQIFLAWVTQKAVLVEVSYKSAAVRAFYFSQAVSRIFEPKLARPLDFSHAVDRALKSNLHDRYLAYNLDGALDIAFKRNAIRQLDYDFLIDLILDCLLVTVAHDLNLFLTFSQDRAFDLDPELKQSLKRFKNQLPDLERDRKRFQQWWKINGKIWTQNLRMAIIQHRNIGYDWQFSPKQKELLRQYYNANKCLIDGLNAAPHVSPEVRQLIENTILLPISEIEERKRSNRI